jgi:hypothetical protein
MQGFSIESKTSEISSSSTLRQDLEARYKLCNEANLTPRSSGTKPEKMTNFEDLPRKVPNLAGQGASSNSERNWQQGPICRRGRILKAREPTPRKGGGWLGRNGPRPVGPTHFGAQSPPFNLAAIQAIYSPEAKSHASIHSSSAAEEQRREDTISERRGSS